MAAPRVDAFLLQLDELWDHDWESLASILRGVSHDEAGWAAPCYADAADSEPSPPQAGSIWWHLHHIAICKRVYTAQIAAQPEPDALLAAPSFEEEHARLQTIHDAQRQAIAALSDEDLDREVPGSGSLASFLATTLRHDIWHAGQIALVRRLYRAASDKTS
ncbi:MAG: DinB family protein [Planctomycetota bacterium]